MRSLLQSIINFFDLRLLVWVPGLWLILSAVTPTFLTQLDRQLFYTGASLSRGIQRPPVIDMLELSSTQMQQLMDDPGQDPDVLSLLEYLSKKQQRTGIILNDLPRPLVPPVALPVTETPPSDVTPPPADAAWQTRLAAQQRLQRWLASPDVIVGSQTFSTTLAPTQQVMARETRWTMYYQWLPASMRPPLFPAAPLLKSANLPWQIFPTPAINVQENNLQQALLWHREGAWYPSMALALLPVQDNLVWRGRSELHGLSLGRLYTNIDGSVIPVFQAQGPFLPVTRHYTLQRFLQQRSEESPPLLLIGTAGDKSLLSLAGLMQSLYSDNYHTSPWWFYGAEKILLLLMLVYLLWILPRMSGGVALLATLLCLLLLLVVQLGGQITQSRWLPLGLTMQYVLWGFLVMALWRQQQKPHKRLQQRHQDVACQLSQQLMQQGQLDQAVKALEDCATSERVLQLLYDIGGQHERKRRLNDALAVYRVLYKRHRSFKDVTKRLKQLTDKQHSPAEDIELTLSKTVVLADPHSRPQFGRYNIEREIGRGAMGVVYLGHDPQIARRVAIKTLDYSRYDTGELAAVKTRFFREAEAAGRLRHPNIVTVYDVGEEHDLAFIAMDYVAGQPLSNFITPKNLLPMAQVYRIVADVAEALAYAHSRQIVHRDIKPGNILYHPDSKKVTVTDFGIARIVSDARTQTGEIVGSPLYMSPEQVKGQKVGEASDIFSLAVTFFQLLSGELPFHGDNIAGLSYQIIHGKHKNIRDLRSQIPTSASRIINKALQKEPGDRYGNAADMARSLRKALQKDFA